MTAIAPPLEVTGCDGRICAAEVRIVGDGPMALVVRHCTTCHAWDSHVACSNCGVCIMGKEYQRHPKGLMWATNDQGKWVFRPRKGLPQSADTSVARTTYGGVP